MLWLYWLETKDFGKPHMEEYQAKTKGSHHIAMALLRSISF
jgi:hypothetical protein